MHTLANSEDPDEMTHYVAFHQGLYCLLRNNRSEKKYNIFIKLTCKKLTEKDCRESKLTTVDPQERRTWRSGVKSAMHAGRGPTDVDDALHPHANQKSDYDITSHPSIYTMDHPDFILYVALWKLPLVYSQMLCVLEGGPLM